MFPGPPGSVEMIVPPGNTWADATDLASRGLECCSVNILQCVGQQAVYLVQNASAAEVEKHCCRRRPLKLLYLEICREDSVYKLNILEFFRFRRIFALSCSIEQ